MSTETKEQKPTITNYRVCQWFDAKTHNMLYGIECKINGEWFNCKDDTGALIFKHRSDASKKKKEMVAELTFVCKSCKHKLLKYYCLRTEGYCYLCDPDITLEEALSDKPILPRN